MQKLNDIQTIVQKAAQWRLKSDKIVFTNGCFDILHVGHIQTLSEAKKLGDKLIVGVNSDDSVKRLKGEERPINSEGNRARLMDSLSMVDAVVIFSEDTPIKLIEAIEPDVLVKGGDWKVKDIVGGDFVIENGGEVHSIPFVENQSTSSLIEKIQKL